MSHFKRIKTEISNLYILKMTLKELGYNYNHGKQYIQDLNGNSQLVDLVAEDKNNNSFGFSWNGQEYSIIADLQMWNKSSSFDYFLDNIIQQYALQSIAYTSVKEGFNQLSQEKLDDGSIKVIVERWH